ncbi:MULTISPECIES: DoxX family protein [unclassified Halomonas]|uniref:DoxX family protein n=1 Tax=unclassified Halomonas TaxID=2609666 RepID=UPI0020767C69|nr:MULTISPECIES: DoxX family protein [unclassified Halomonas]
MPTIPLLIIALFFFLGGIAHFALTDFFILAMPDYLGYHRELVLISGVFELLGAVGILVPSTRKLAGWGLIALMVAVFPANVHMALHPEAFPSIPVWLLYARLPLQALLIAFVWWAIHRKTAELAP